MINFHDKRMFAVNIEKINSYYNFQMNQISALDNS